MATKKQTVPVDGAMAVLGLALFLKEPCIRTKQDLDDLLDLLIRANKHKLHQLLKGA